MLEFLIVLIPLRLCCKTKFSWNVFISLQSFEIYFTAVSLFLKVTKKLRLHILFLIFKSGTPCSSREIFSTVIIFSANEFWRDQVKVIITILLIKK